MGRWSAVLLVAFAGSVIAAQAAERPPATLMPAGMAMYGEANLALFTGESPEAAVIRDAFARSGLLAAVRTLVSDSLGAVEGVDTFLAMVSEGSRAFGPWLGWGVSTADANRSARSRRPEPPAFLIVAQVKEAAAAERLLDRALAALEVEWEEETLPGGVHVRKLDEGGEVALGPDWIALGGPSGVGETVARLAAGGEGSLAADPSYQRAMKGLPKDAVLTQYVIAPALARVAAAASAAAPSVLLPSLPRDGLASAVRIAVESQEGRHLLSVSWVVDIDAASPAVTAPAVAVLAPAIARAGASARKVECLSNMKNIALALQMYLTDWDAFPQADRWVPALDDYVQDPKVFHCPEDCSGERSSYGMNQSLSGKPTTSLRDPAWRVAIYETAHPGDCPRGGPEDVVSPPRHLGGNHYAYPDGHVRWVSEAAAATSGDEW